MKKHKLYKSQGFTLIELILYIALVSGFLTGSIKFLWDVIYVKEKTVENNTQTYNALNVLGKANYWALHSQNFTDFDNNLSLSSITKTNLSNENSENAQVEIPALEIRGAWELAKPNLSARYTLVDLTSASLVVVSQSLTGISLRNSGTEDIVLDEIYIEWNNISDATRVTEIQIEGSVVWTGSVSNENTIDISNVTIPADSTITIDYIKFNDEISEGELIIEFIMEDESFVRGEFDLIEQEGAPTGCSQACIDREVGFNYGNCVQNTSQCSGAGGTRAPEGDEFCTGGPAADTCCCLE